MLIIDDLLVSQEAVEACKIDAMKKFVLANGIWTQQALIAYGDYGNTRHGRQGILSPLIAITRFEDGTLLIQNGHHRIRATREVRDFLHPEEYIISDREVSEYLQVNFDRTFVTPFDPRSEIRLFDFRDYKKKVLALAEKDQAQALLYISSHPEEYKKTRIIIGVMELLISNSSREDL